jgi:hypothetical protein
MAFFQDAFGVCPFSVAATAASQMGWIIMSNLLSGEHRCQKLDGNLALIGKCFS